MSKTRPKPFYKQLPKDFITKVFASSAIFFVVFIISRFVFNNLTIEIFRLADLGQADIDFTDLYYQTKKQDTPEKNLVMINIGSAPRDQLRLEIIKLIKRLNAMSAKTIGIDLYFEEKNDSAVNRELDSLLQAPHVVFGVDFETTPQFPLNKASATRPAYINFPREANRTTRTYYNHQTVYYNKSETRLEAFATKLFQAGKYGKTPKQFLDSVYMLRYHGTDVGFYNWSRPDLLRDPGDLPAVEAKQVLTDTTNRDLDLLIRNSVVVIGWLGSPEMNASADLEDKHIVPVNSSLVNRAPTMPGALIHANALQMMLRNEYIIIIKPWQQILIGIVLSLILMSLFLMLECIKEKIVSLLFDFILIYGAFSALIRLSLFVIDRDIYLPAGEYLGGLFLMAWCKEHCFSIYEYLKKKHQNNKHEKKIVVANVD